MKSSFVLAMISLWTVVLAFRFPSLWILLIWTAASFGIVAIAYAGKGAGVIGKRSDGSIPLHRKLLILPYLFFASAVWHLVRLTSREDAFNKVDENLVIGRRLLAHEIPNGFDHYIDLTAEFEDPKAVRIQSSYRCLPILDADIPTPEELDSAVRITLEGRAYIHCAQGHGRTGIFALALLAERGKLENIEDGLRVLQELRPAIALNAKQTEFMRSYLSRKSEDRY